jgi:hypothetical protein
VKAVKVGWMVILTLASPALPAGVAAQSRAGSELVGERVRVTSVSGGEPVVGELASYRADAVEIRDSTGVVHSVPLDEIDRVQRSLGVRSGAGRGAGMGAVLGLLAGGATGLVLIHGFCSGHEDCSATSYAGGAALVGLAGLVGGLGIGALIGSASSSEKWADVSLGDDHGVAVRFGVVPSSGRTVRWGVAVSVR